MNKKIAALSICCVFAFGTVFGLASCGVNPPIDPPTPGPGISQPGDDPSEKPEEKPDEPSGGEQPTVPTVLDRAKQLADNIDGLPDMSEIDNIGNDARSKSAARAARVDRDVVDLSVPVAENVDDYDSHYGQQIQFINGQIERFKQLKDEAIETCKQFGVWVAHPRMSYDYKVSYDKQSDTVTVEQRDGEGSVDYYCKAESSYNAFGKMHIKAQTVSRSVFQSGKEDVFSLGVDYVEGESWTCAYYEPQENLTFDAQFNFLVHADLTSSDRKITKFSLQSVEHTDPSSPEYGEQEFNARKTVITEYGGNPIVIELSDFAFNDGNDIFELYNANGGLLLNNRVNTVNGERHTEFNLYALDGWDRAFYYPDESPDALNHVVRMQIGDNEYGGAEYYFDGADSSRWWLRASTYHSGQTPKPVISCVLKNGQSYVEFLAKWGLSVKPEYADTFAYLCGESADSWDYDEFLHGWNAFGIDGVAYSDVQTMINVCEKMNEKLDVLSYDAFVTLVEQLNADPAVSFDEQVAESEIYQNANIAISGNVGIDETFTFDLSEIKCEIPATILLEEGAIYTLTVALINDGDVIVLDTCDATYDRAGITIEGLGAEIALPDGLNENERYILVAYLVKGVDGERISEYKYPSPTVEDEYSDVTTETDEKEDMIVITESGTIVTCADTVIVEKVHHVTEIPVEPEETEPTEPEEKPTEKPSVDPEE